MADQILVEYKTTSAGLIAEHKAMQDEMRKTESVSVKSAENTTKAIAKTEEKAKSLKSQYRELKAQLADATDPKDVERLAKAAGKLADQIEDASDAARVFASESKFEQVGNAIGSVGSKLRNLDFKGAADQSKLLLSATKGITFKEGILGVKDFGTTMLNIGKSLLLNPIFLIGGALIAIITNFDKLRNAGGVVGKVFGVIGDILGGVVTGLEKVANLIGAIDTESQAIYDRQKANLDALAEAQAKTSDRIIKILKAQGKETTDLELQKVGKQIAINEKQYQAYRNLLIRQGKDFENLSEEELKTLNDLGNKKADLIAEEQAIYFSSQEEKKAKNKKISDDLIAEANRLAKVLRDLQTGNIALEYDRKKQQILDNFSDESEKYKGHNEILIELEKKKNKDLQNLYYENEAKKKKILEDGQKDYIKAFKEGVKTIEGEDTKLADHVIKNQENIKQSEADLLENKKRMYAEFYNFLNSTIQAAQQISQNIAQAQLDDVQEKSIAETEALQEQYNQGIISKTEYEERKKAIDQKTAKEEAQIKKKAFETNKQLALIQVAISTAQTIAKTASELGYPAALPFIALAAANAALQIAAIQSQPTPKFEKGGKVGGKRHSQGGTLIEAEVDEYVVNRKEAMRNDKLLTAINKGQGQKYIREMYIAPALKAQRRKYEERKDRSMIESLSKTLTGGGFKDGNLLDSLKQSRRNDRQIAQYLVKELKGSQRSNHKW